MFWKKILALFLLITLCGTLLAFQPKGGTDIAEQNPNFTASPLMEMIPGNTPVLVHFKGFEGVQDRFFGFLANALPDYAEKVRTDFTEELKRGLENRKIQGLSRQGPHFIAMLEFPKEGQQFDTKQVIFALRVTDYKMFRDGFLKTVEKKNIVEEKGLEWTPLEGLDTTVYMARKGNYALVALSKEAGLKIQTRGDSLARRISPMQSKKLLERDLGVYLNLDTLGKDYNKMMESLKKEATTSLQILDFFLPREQQGVAKLARSAIEGLFQAVRDGNGFLATLDFRPTGIVFHSELEYRPDSPTSKLFAGAKPDAMEGLEKMPSGHGFYIAQQTQSPFIAKITSLAMGLMPGEEGKKTGKAISNYLKARTAIRYDAVSLPSSGLQVIEAEEPAKTKELMLEMFQVLSEGESFQNRLLKIAPKIQKKAKSLEGIEFDEIVLEWDLEKMLAQAAKGGQAGQPINNFQSSLLKKTLGDSMNLWVGTKGKEVWITSGSNWEQGSEWVKKRLEGVKDLKQNKHYHILRKDLQQKNDILILMDPMKYIKLIMGILVSEGQFPVKLDDAQETYWGFAATFGEDRSLLEWVISSASVREIYEKVVKPITGELR